MPGWTELTALNANACQVFTRPLGLTELCFYWDSVFSGTADILVQATVETLVSLPSELFSPEKVTRTWIALKNLHPLLGASINEQPDAAGAEFVVDENRLNTVGRDEIIFKSLPSDGDACTLADKTLNESRTLSNDLLAQLWIISLPRDLFRHHVFLLMAHCIGDGMAQNTFIKNFFDILTHDSTPEVYVPRQNLESRLALHPAIEDLHPTRKYSIAKQRWRRAIAQVIHKKRVASLRGGHTLPREITSQACQTPAVSCTFKVTLSKGLSRCIMASCRRAKITFGQALPVLAQLGHARVLHRLYLHGFLSEAEWAHRIIQPMHMGGPLNLRPYLDKEWLASGGTDRVCVAISFYRNTLPSIPLPRSLGSGNMEQPPFEAFLSKARFFHRCQGVKRQTAEAIRHPLFLEFTKISRPARIESARATALNWRARSAVLGAAQGQGGFDPSIPAVKLGGTELLSTSSNSTFSNGCSSFGNMDDVILPEYPSRLANRNSSNKWSSEPPLPYLRINSIHHYLRCRSAELYLTSMSSLQQLQLVVFCDTRTFDKHLVIEWLSNIAQATEWYLGTDGVMGAKGYIARL